MGLAKRLAPARPDTPDTQDTSFSSKKKKNLLHQNTLIIITLGSLSCPGCQWGPEPVVSTNLEHFWILSGGSRSCPGQVRIRVKNRLLDGHKTSEKHHS